MFAGRTASAGPPTYARDSIEGPVENASYSSHAVKGKAMLARPRALNNRPNILPLLVVVLGTLLSAGVVFASLPAGGRAAPAPLPPPANTGARHDANPKLKPRL